MTDVVVSRLKFNGTYYDEMTPAFGLRVGKNRKAWFVVRGRERLRTNIGQYPATSLADAYKRVLEKYLQPKLGTKKLADISYDEITGIIHPLAHSEKRNTLAVGRTFFRWCVRPPRRYLKHSPLEGVEIPKAGKRKRILNEEELITVWHATVRQGYQLMPNGKRAQGQTEIRNGRMPTSSAPRRQAGSLGHRWRQANVVADHCAES